MAKVLLWGSWIGSVQMPDREGYATFEYSTEYLASRTELAPLEMPLGPGLFAFPELRRESFYGLPGMLADAIPDRFGTALIDEWLTRKGIPARSFNAVDRLCYIGHRAMGALEFEPATGPQGRQSKPLNVADLVELASEVLTRRQSFSASLSADQRGPALQDLLLVGTSAGGARAKAVIAYNPTTNEVRSGQLAAPEGFEHWIIKFDGVSGNTDKDLGSPRGYGAVELAYSEMAKAAGIATTESRLLEEGGRRHFMTRRFDRLGNRNKLHMQSLAALRHFDYNLAGAYSYEQALETIQLLELDGGVIQEQMRRMIFNVLARNQDDHVKNIAFLMDRLGTWALSPAFDLTYAFNPRGDWTASHQMSINGKRDRFTANDIYACGRSANLSRPRVKGLVEQVASAVERWLEYADHAGVPEGTAVQIGRAHRRISTTTE